MVEKSIGSRAGVMIFRAPKLEKNSTITGLERIRKAIENCVTRVKAGTTYILVETSYIRKVDKFWRATERKRHGTLNPTPSLLKIGVSHLVHNRCGIVLIEATKSNRNEWHWHSWHTFAADALTHMRTLLIAEMRLSPATTDRPL